MRPIDHVAGHAYPLGRDNVDTDVILPARFLKTITRNGLGIAAFETLRAEPGNIFEDPAWKGAPILIAGANFGCGSSREHAVWAMMDLGISVVIAQGFSDIFAGNAFKNGMLTIVLPRETVMRLLEWAQQGSLTIDLRSQCIGMGGEQIAFEMDPFRKNCLLNGLDEIGLTLAFAPEIAAYEKQMAQNQPWLSPSG